MKRYLTPVIAAVLVALMFAIPASSNIFWDIIGGNLHFKNSGRKSAVFFGQNTDGVDVTIHGATTGKYWMWDESADKMIVVGSFDLNGSGVQALGPGRNVPYLAITDSLVFAPSAYSDISDSGLVVYRTGGQPVVSFRGADDDEWNITLNTSDQALFRGAGGGYVFDDDIVSAGTIYVRPSQTSDDSDSTLYFTVSAGEPVINFKASDDDATQITVNTDDQLLFKGASGGYVFDNKIIGGRQSINAADANAEDLTAANSGALYTTQNFGELVTFTLPAAAAGLTYDIFAVSADSLIVTTASGDSLLTSAGTAYKTTSSVAGTLRLVAIDETKWLMLFATGTWTSY